MSEAKPFTVRQRRRLCGRLGHRPVNDWGGGDLPGPWAEGDVVRLARPGDKAFNKRLRQYGTEGDTFVISYATSIDEGDAWYFRVADGGGGGSDRLHVAFADRSEFTEDIDFMAPFDLVETADPDGLAKRGQMLADGWGYTRIPRCEACGAMQFDRLSPSPVVEKEKK